MLPYRDFYYPLNVFMHILTLEEGSVRDLHYGFFAHPGESIHDAQARSTAMLLERLPPPPARLLEVGIGLGTTLSRLRHLGYDAEGITPDPHQIAWVRSHDPSLPVTQVRFEDIIPDRPYDTVIFQESAQYIAADALFAKARTLTPRIVVLDEFSFHPAATLHSYETFAAAGTQHGFRLVEEVDVSRQAAPSIEYFTTRFPRYRPMLMNDLGLTNEQIDELIAGGEKYVAAYREGGYGYRVMVWERG